MTAVIAVMGAVGPDACNRVPPKIEVMIGITAAPIIPANAPLPDIVPNAAPKERAAKLTVSPAIRSRTSVCLSIFALCCTASADKEKSLGATNTTVPASPLCS
jgi:hypothetical protein